MPRLKGSAKSKRTDDPERVVKDLNEVILSLGFLPGKVTQDNLNKLEDAIKLKKELTDDKAGTGKVSG